jgi:hypothetical protein
MLFREKTTVHCENHTKHTQIHSVGRMQSFSMLNQVVHIELQGFKGLMNFPVFDDFVAVYCYQCWRKSVTTAVNFRNVAGNMEQLETHGSLHIHCSRLPGVTSARHPFQILSSISWNLWSCISYFELLLLQSYAKLLEDLEIGEEEYGLDHVLSSSGMQIWLYAVIGKYLFQNVTRISIKYNFNKIITKIKRIDFDIR